MPNKKTTVEAIAEEIASNEEINLQEVEVAVAQKRATTDLNELQHRQNKFLEHVRSEKKVSVSVAPQYASEFSNNMRVTINGISIFIPIDGKAYMVPETFAAEIQRRVAKVNAKLNRFKKKNGRSNDVIIEEKSIGEIKLY
jgi:hypothetical protein